MSATQFIKDASTRHQVFLQRFAGGQSKKAVSVLMRLRRDINARLSQEPTAFQSARLRSVLDDIEKLIVTGFSNLSTTVKLGHTDLAASEADFSATLYSKASKVEFAIPSESALLSAVELAPMTVSPGLGTAIDDALSAFGRKKAAQITQLITDGVVLGDTTPQISAKVSGLMDNMQRRQTGALVRTITNHISSVARMETLKTNERLLDGYEWISTLDSRTTLICGGRDGIKYQTGQGPMPPAHWNCRSTTIPTIKPEFSLGGLTGTRSARGPDGVARVSSKLTYGGWLKKQPVEFIDEALGVERSRLFRSGKLPIGKFTDPTGRVYTLDELRSRNQITFLES